MAITTTLQTKYTLQRVFMILICLVMGVWGVYDYLVKIPSQERAFRRGQICLVTKNAMEVDPSSPSASVQINDARDEVQAEIEALTHLVAAEQPDPEEMKQALESVKARNEQNWLAMLVLFQNGLREAQTRVPGNTPTESFRVAYEVAKQGVNDTAEVSPPGKFDRATQWMFIACLPFVPYFVWSFARVRGRIYRLDEEGTLHFPGGSWPREEIADVDMSRWMAKSTAEIVHRDGRRIKLDDYVHRHTHLIVGAMASERYPDAWDDQARRKTRSETAETTDEAEASATDEASEAGGEEIPVERTAEV